MSDDKPDRVRRACADLARTGDQVTLTAVADATGSSRATLYRRRDLRELVEGHRDPGGQTPTLTGLTDQIDRLHQSVEALADRVRRHEEQLRRMNKKIS
jgi:hypothetical protein